MLFKKSLFFCTFLLSTSQAYAVKSCKHDNMNFKCLEFITNHDSDSLTVNIPLVHPLIGSKIKFNLVNITSPSLRSRIACEKNLAKEARYFVRETLKNAKYIEAKDVFRDRSFAFRGEIFYDGKNLSRKLISKGYAKERTKKKVKWC